MKNPFKRIDVICWLAGIASVLFGGAAGKFVMSCIERFGGLK